MNLRTEHLLFLSGAFALGACATPRMYSVQELSAVGRACGLAEGELVQEEELKRVLFLYRAGPSKSELACVTRWSRKHNLHLAWIEGVTRVPN